MTAPKSQLQRDLNAIEKLISSRGWAIVREAMQHETETVMQQMAADPNMTNEQTHYYRGMLHSAFQLQGVPAKLKTQIETDFLLHKDDLKPKS